MRRFAPLVLLATLLAACGTPAKAADEVVVGVSLELSGPTASIGTASRRALERKAQELNASGALGGRRIKLVVKDNRTDNNTSVANINDLIKNDHADAVITGGCSQCTLAAVPAITENRVPTISLAAAGAVTSPVVDRRYVFKTTQTPGQDAQLITDELTRCGTTRVGVIAVSNVYGQEGQAEFTRRARAAGITVAETEQFGQADADMTIQVSKIVAARPRAVVVWAVSPAAPIVVRELRDARYRGEIYLGAGAGPDVLAEGVHLAFPKTLATPGPYSGFASFAADALQLIADAVVTTGGTDHERLRDAIENARLDGASGPLRFSAEDHSGLRSEALGILTAHEGRWQLTPP
ncbi:branched-chain amino acid ABC transporter [Paractinoplanes deccanensis]|uniref:Branched-chain amino acid ABC transporter n=1 Tax=Paractinoplanes deccanensis TaxID=113561 RepID=A0ABQ3XX18_9ACTN|nr:ABC transporter substrate-binding protein [Actinoplanes deccanensis]GID72295.1 branched-chain amino acid ABC transporter [Actinoplanes deccanensis]